MKEVVDRSMSPTMAAGTSARARISQGDIGELGGYLRRGLRKALPGLSDHDIEDFTHDAIVRILQDLGSFRGDSRFTTWAMAVAVRVAFGALRRRRYRERRVELDSRLVETAASGWDPVDDPTERVQQRNLLTVLRRAIDEGLTERQRAAVLGELGGTPSEVLADRLGITRNAFYKLHHDARKKLKTALVEAGFTEQDVLDELRAN